MDELIFNFIFTIHLFTILLYYLIEKFLNIIIIVRYPVKILNTVQSDNYFYEQIFHGK